MARQVLNGVTNYYGPRSQFDGVSGSEATRDDNRELVIFARGGDIGAVAYTIPAGSVIVGNSLVEVSEAFVLGGTTPLLNIGVSGTEATNRLAQLSEAQAEAIGTYSLAPAGTLAINTPLAADAAIRMTLTGGGANTIGDAGRLKLAVTYKSI